MTLSVRAWGTDASWVPAESPRWRDGPCAADGAEDPTGACVRRITGAREGVTEWWENGPSGLEQGFEFAAQPGATEVAVELAVDDADVIVDGGAAFVLSDGTTLRYDGLYAQDATGAALPARMEPVDGGLRLVVGVGGAAWPVTIDPVISSHWVVPAPSGATGFGEVVAGAGDVDGDGYADVLVAAPDANGGAGAVWLYYGSAAGPETTADWTASGALAAEFGTSMAGLGDTNGDGYDDFAVGAPHEGDGEAYEGLVYVWLGGPAGPAAAADAVLEVDQAGAALGVSVAGAGDTNGDGFDDVIAGAWVWDGTVTNEGGAFVFLGSATGPSSAAAWSAGSGIASSRFGQVVAGIGDVDGDGYDDVAVGAPVQRATYSSAGMAYVYMGSAAGPSTSAAWTVGGSQSGAHAGGGIGRAGDVNGDGYDDLLVAETYYGSSDEGQARLFLGSASGLATASTWTASGSSQSHFGETSAGCDVNGDGYSDLALGRDAGTSTRGQVSLYYGGPSGPSTTVDVPVLSSPSDFEGVVVADAGDVNGDGYADLLVGEEDGGTDDEGLARLFFGGADGPTVVPSYAWTTSIDELGETIADAGDLDGDGYGDLALTDSDSTGYRGFVYVFMGAAGGLSTTAAISFSGDDYFGSAIAGAGDVDGDGDDELLIGAYDTTNTLLTQGTTWIYYGDPGGLSATSFTRLDGAQIESDFGRGLDGVGDVNGDGYDDVAIGAGDQTGTLSYEGVVSVYFGGPSGLTTVGWSAAGGQSGARLGTEVHAAGDVNGDGYPDILAGASDLDDGVRDEGAIFLWYGSASGPVDSGWSAEGDQEYSECSGGYGIGDVTGDGYDDVAYACFRWGVTRYGQEGRVEVYFGGPAGPSGTPDWSIFGASLYDGVGYDVAGLGDLDGDGDDEFVIGAPGTSDLEEDEGAAWLFLGDPSGPAATPDLTFEEHGYANALGYAVSGTSDVDGDGYRELVVAGANGSNVYLYEFQDADGDGSMSFLDCDDADPTAWPGATETCDGTDEDCDGEIDEDPPTWYADADGDGYGDPSAPEATCSPSAGYVTDAADCDDTDATVSPGAPEVCGGGDEDCDGATDEADASDVTTWFADVDGDGYGDPAVGVADCEAPAGFVSDGTDCDDTDAATSPAGVELCGGGDEDCDGLVDEPDGVGASTRYADADGDGYGDAAAAEVACTAPPGFVADASDCDDASGSASPAGVEACGGGDEDCDGQADEPGAVGESAWYLDADGDGYGDATAAVLSCGAPTGTVADALDCDDADSTVHPGAAEAWYDGVDGNCDGADDFDADADGYDAVGGGGDDCDDTRADAHSGAPEAWYDGVDQDCDGADDFDADADGQASATWGGDDCDDADAAVYLGAPDDPYDGVDAACDGEYDADGDAHLSVAFGGDDCDDARSDVYPGAPEVWYDGVDQDCDGADDDADGDGLSSADDCDDTDPAVGRCDTGAGDTGSDDTGAGDTGVGDTDVEDTDTSPPETGDTDAGDTSATETGDTNAGDTDTSATGTGDTDTGGTDTADTDSGAGTGPADTGDPAEGCSGCAAGGGLPTGLVIAVSFLLLRRRRVGVPGGS